MDKLSLRGDLETERHRFGYYEGEKRVWRRPLETVEG